MCAPVTSCGSDADCPAGLGCSSGQCTAPQTCDAYLAAMGATCVSDDACQSALRGGHCLRPSESDAGYCTAQCAVVGSAAQCTLLGTGATCQVAGDHQVCVRAAP